MAQGQLIHIGGRILDEAGRPVRVRWSSSGRPMPPAATSTRTTNRDAPLDPNFIGNGRIRTDEEGRYGFFTIKPGAYPVPTPMSGGGRRMCISRCSAQPRCRGW